MTIEEADYRLKPAMNDASNFWDLELLVTIKPKGTNSVARKEFKSMGYGMPIESCIQRIANYRILHKHGGDAITMIQYLKEYISQIKELKDKLLVKDSKPQLLE